MKTMTVNHPRWSEFLKRLTGKEGCNFRKDDKGRARWTCKGGFSRPFATKILKEMGDIDAPRSLKYFESRGGFCDCEIVFNVPVRRMRPLRLKRKVK